MTETPGHINSRPLLDECADAVFANWHMTPPVVAKEVLAVLRRRGLLNDQGVEIVTQEIGPLTR